MTIKKVKYFWINQGKYVKPDLTELVRLWHDQSKLSSEIEAICDALSKKSKTIISL